MTRFEAKGRWNGQARARDKENLVPGAGLYGDMVAIG
jgi:hypothetical protein